MKPAQKTVLDPRDAAAIVRELLARAPAYLPGWRPRQGQAGWALLQIYARMVRAILERLNQAPDKNGLAFLEMLGLSLRPARGARAPVAFRVIPNLGDGRAPAGTRLGAAAQPPASDSIPFETESGIALASARLTDLVSLCPRLDAYADHSAALLAGRAFQPFTGMQRVPHVLYLAHDTLCALSGVAQLEIEFTLQQSLGGRGFDLAWEYWDGQDWRPLEIPAGYDGTAGLTQSGTMELQLAAGDPPAGRTTVNGVKAYWVRGRLITPLPPRRVASLPVVDAINLRPDIRRKFRNDVVGVQGAPPGPIYGSVSDLPADCAFADGVPVDLTRAFQPLGQSPQTGTAFYLACEEAFSKPDAEVTVCFHRMETVQEEIDQKDADYELDVNDARASLKTAALLAGNAARTAGARVLQFWQLGGLDAALLNLANAQPIDLLTRIEELAQAVDAVKAAVAGMAGIVVANALTVASEELDYASALMAELVKFGPVTAAAAAGIPPPELAPPRLVWEYWNGAQWRTLVGPDLRDPLNLLASSDKMNAPLDAVTFRAPADWGTVEVEGVTARWLRARLATGSYDRLRWISWHDPVADQINFVPVVETRPPKIESLFVGYQYNPAAGEAPEHCLSFNDFRYADHTRAASAAGGAGFTPFRPVADATPALYLGFDKPLPSDLVSLYLDKREQESRPAGPPLAWEMWDGAAWQVLPATDETACLARPGMVSFIARPSPLLPRFGVPRAWVRARLKEDGSPLTDPVDGLHPNATWAVQRQTIQDEVLGSSSGQPRQSFFFRHTPVLPGERIEVRELAGARAAVELPILAEELPAEAIRTVTDARTGRVTEVWVCWRERPHFYFSGPDDRHYVVERGRGRLLFGDGVNGRIPPPGPNNVRARRYQSGGGLAGNVPAGTITQLLGLASPAQGVSNLRAGEGGADLETTTAFRWRAPQDLRHRWRALSADDYRALALEASPSVAVARPVPGVGPGGRTAPGWITLVIVPGSPEARPQPSADLRRQVQEWLAARAPAGLAGLRVIGPSYHAVDVSVTVAPLDPAEAGPVEQRVRAALERFLHPLGGGPEGAGWPFGRDVYLCDVAAVLEAVEGVDYVEALQLLLDAVPQGERAPVPADRLVAAGQISIRMTPPESKRR